MVSDVTRQGVASARLMEFTLTCLRARERALAYVTFINLLVPQFAFAYITSLYYYYLFKKKEICLEDE